MRVCRSGMFVLLVSLLSHEFAMGQAYRSADQRAIVIELFTSEGCSSCPPAERWLNNFTQESGLWDHYFPIAWHVDYWDSIGWPDRYARQHHSARQWRYKRQTSLRSVYTPGVLVDGKAWRGWARNSIPVRGTAANVGQLTAAVQDKLFTVHFSPNQKHIDQRLILHVAILGFGLQTHVTRGENRGKTLRHDFVVLADAVYQTSSNDWSGTLPVVTRWEEKSQRLAVVFWLEHPDSPVPVIITGGWLSGDRAEEV